MVRTQRLYIEGRPSNHRAVNSPLRKLLFSVLSELEVVRLMYTQLWEKVVQPVLN